jgi:hypothetical protein
VRADDLKRDIELRAIAPELTQQDILLGFDNTGRLLLSYSQARINHYTLKARMSSTADQSSAVVLGGSNSQGYSWPASWTVLSSAGAEITCQASAPTTRRPYTSRIHISSSCRYGTSKGGNESVASSQYRCFYQAVPS